MTDPLLGMNVGSTTALVVVKGGQIIWIYHYPRDDEDIYFEPMDEALDVAYAEGADEIATVKISSTIYFVESRQDLAKD